MNLNRIAYLLIFFLIFLSTVVPYFLVIVAIVLFLFFIYDRNREPDLSKYTDAELDAMVAQFEHDAANPPKSKRKSKPVVQPKVPTRKVNVRATYGITPEIKRLYLSSAEWHKRRIARLKFDHYTCQGCGVDGVPLEIHHLHYRTFRHETNSDLVSLCRSCHQHVHNTYGYDYASNFPLIKS